LKSKQYNFAQQGRKCNLNPNLRKSRNPEKILHFPSGLFARSSGHWGGGGWGAGVCEPLAMMKEDGPATTAKHAADDGLLASQAPQGNPKMQAWVWGERERRWGLARPMGATSGQMPEGAVAGSPQSLPKLGSRGMRRLL